MHTCGFLILAAGSSSRLGEPKQLLPLGDLTLLQHTINEALALQSGPVLIVLGSNAELILPTLDNEAVSITINTAWAEGMASSIRVGMQALLSEYPLIAAVILMVCDQPYLSRTHLLQLIQEAEGSGKGIAASSYGETAGTPVLFSRKYFPVLIEVKGKDGAKSLVHRFAEDVCHVSFANGEIDIDTREDYNKLLDHPPGATNTLL
jgi:molybdenum cofactor cytidylyltransferase